VARLHVGHHHGPQAAAGAHEARRAVAVEGAARVDAGAAVLALALWIAPLALVNVLLAPAGRGAGGGTRKCW
jgi:hypothetical protein